MLHNEAIFAAAARTLGEGPRRVWSGMKGASRSLKWATGIAPIGEAVQHPHGRIKKAMNPWHPIKGLQHTL